MATGDILRGDPGFPLYGKNGTVLYSTDLSMSINIAVYWSGGEDLDICAFYTHFPDSVVGYSYSRNISDGNGFTASWSGDNVSGGPEYVNLAYSGPYGLDGKSFEIHANWYDVGDGEESGSGGNATIKVTDAKGHTHWRTVRPATGRHRAARAGDPGAVIRFKNDGTIKSVTEA